MEDDNLKQLYVLIFTLFLLLLPLSSIQASEHDQLQDQSSVTILVDDVSLASNGTGTGCVSVFNVSRLGSFSLNVSWDPAVVDVTDVVNMSSFEVYPYVNHSMGFVNMTGYRMSGISGFVDLIRLDFHGIGINGSVCGVTIEYCQLLSADPLPQPIEYTVVNGSVIIENESVDKHTTVLVDNVSLPSGGNKSGCVSVFNVSRLGSFSLNVSWDPSVVDVTDVVNMSSFEVYPYVDHSMGFVNMTGYRMRGISGFVDLIRLDFHGIGINGSVCELTIEYCELLSAKPTPETIDHDIINGTITILGDQDDDDDDNTTGGGGNGGSGTSDIILPEENKKPEAKITVSTTTEFIGIPITFKATESTDPDGTIQKYEWNFGDGTILDKKIINHSYTQVGEYTVMLTVTDNDGAIDQDNITIAISESPNNPPQKPTITGPTSGEKNTEYTFTITSTDPDNDTIRFSIDWGDETNTQTEFIPQNTQQNITHQWNEADRYNINIHVTDNKTVSATTTHTILIDAIELYYNGSYLGYLTDEDSDGIFDAFNKNTAQLNHTKSGTYLIDSNNDGKWDYEYDHESGIVQLYTPKVEPKEPQESNLALQSLIIILIITIITLLILKYKKKSNDTKDKKEG